MILGIDGITFYQDIMILVIGGLTFYQDIVMASTQELYFVILFLGICGLKMAPSAQKTYLIPRCNYGEADELDERLPSSYLPDHLGQRWRKI